MKLVKSPHLPEGVASLFMCDRSINKKLENSFLSFEHENVLNGINTHPDMTFCPLYDGDAVVCKEGYEYYKKLTEYGFNIIKGENVLKKEYPFDIAYNVVLLNGKLFHNLKYTDKAILDYCKKRNVELVNVKQGYTKCSTLIVDKKSVITCDKKLNDVYNKHGIDSILVSNSDILINGFDHGFIGGCGGRISDKTIGFFGDVTVHRDFKLIKEFLDKKNQSYKILIDGPLFDYGSLIPLCEIT